MIRMPRLTRIANAARPACKVARWLRVSAADQENLQG